MDKQPLVSVCLPTYNNSAYIRKTIRSILGQTYKNIEIIVSDNASTDDTERIVRGFSDSRIQYHKRAYTVSCNANWNACVELAKADYVAIYHTDDIYEPDIVEKELSCLAKNPEAGAVFCLDRIINEKDVLIGDGVGLPPELAGEIVIVGFQELLRALLAQWMNILVAPTFMAKKEIFGNVGYFMDPDKDTQYGQAIGSAVDTEFWLRIAKKYKVGVINQRLIRRRISTMAGTTIYECGRLERANHFRVLDHYLDEMSGRMEFPRVVLDQYAFNKWCDDTLIAKNLALAGRQKDARKLIARDMGIHTLCRGLRNTQNMKKMIVGILLFCATVAGVASPMLKAYRNAKRNERWQRILRYS